MFYGDSDLNGLIILMQFAGSTYHSTFCYLLSNMMEL